MVPDGTDPGSMGVARLRHVRGRGRGALRRLGRRAASAGMAGTGTGLFARSAILGARLRNRSRPRGARVGVRPARCDATGQLHHVGQCAVGPRGPKAWRGARWHDYNTRLRCRLVGASEMSELLAPDEPAPVRVLRKNGPSELFLTADHAGRTIPRGLGQLG